ncbi:hypothetical protein OESDEN_06679 [Oesophagostomum dentatum]|uniref:SXP/RAL-2 family protein Ani s 5-like cation-binding domain-containing protein n=1 Tax=Oesophagostomum dentatum TaxID=61180 RepID=A0A0B1TC42_OESDE|nr:hypothetical protein OESDEN_06679 [Oesophagostomum dentatum]
MSRAVLCLVFGFIAVAYAMPPFGRHFGFLNRPCELPPFIDDLPEDAAQKIRDIWKDYKEGDKCYTEHGLTREVLDTLSKEDRKKMHKGFLPPVLRKAPKDVQEQFRAIFRDRSIPFEDKPDKIHELAQKVLQGDLLKEFNEFHNKMEEHRKNIEEMAEKLSPEAKEAYNKLKDIEKQKREIMGKLSESARDELFELFKEKRNRPRH